MKAPPPRNDEPREPRRSGAGLLGLALGVGFGFVLVFVLDAALDDPDLEQGVWRLARYAAIALFGWIGHMIGSGRGRTVAENVEALAIAVVMALILKHFLVEAYKIPTGSMQPTILGNDEAQIFDRVLVNKFAYLVGEPERFDVVVFKYPLDRSKNYIKRVAGLPGERVWIRQGNVYFARRRDDGAYGEFQVARKPDHVREAVMKRVYPSGTADESFAEAFETAAGTVRQDGDALEFSPGARIRYGHGEGVRDRYLDGYDPDWGIPAPPNVGREGSEPVGDLEVALEIEPASGSGELVLTLAGNGREHVARVPFGSGEATVSTGGGGDGATRVEVGRSATALPPNETSSVVFTHVDQELILAVGGEVIVRHAYDDSPDGGSHESGVDVATTGAARVSDLVLARDIHYLPLAKAAAGPFDVPDDGYFMLGDNTQNSSDSRHWAVQEVRFSPQHRVLRDRDQRASHSAPGAFLDVYGETYRIDRARGVTIHEVPGNEYSFVPKKLLLGKALAVFWPVFPHFRWKLLR